MISSCFVFFGEIIKGDDWNQNAMVPRMGLPNCTMFLTGSGVHQHVLSISGLGGTQQNGSVQTSEPSGTNVEPMGNPCFLRLVPNRCYCLGPRSLNKQSSCKECLLKLSWNNPHFSFANIFSRSSNSNCFDCHSWIFGLRFVETIPLTFMSVWKIGILKPMARLLARVEDRV